MKIHFVARVFPLFLILTLLLGAAGLPTASVKAADTITFSGTELLGRPTSTSITVNIVPNAAIQYYYEYGTTSGVYTGQTAYITAAANQPSEVVISGLLPNTRYYYRMRYHAPGDAMDDWVIRSERSFWTQRAAGSTFTFTVTADSHVNIMLGNATTWTQTMTNVANNNPDFVIDLGDTFAMDNVTTVAGAETAYLYQRQFFDLVGHSAPIFLAPGNHEQEEGWHLDDTGNPATSQPVLGTNARKKYYPNPIPDSFYSGDTSTYSYLDGDQLREDYYAWTWGDVLFVVIDPFWFTMTKPFTGNIGGGESSDAGSGDRWDWTLGLEQFNWLKQTLENSTARYKFVFAHHMTGGSDDYVRGGANPAHIVEWGGYNENGTTYAWTTRRPVAQWGTDPVHQVLVNNHVSAFIHGHDHQYAYEARDGVVYLSMPSGGFSGNGFNIYSTGSGYTIQALPSPGHIRVTVNPTQATVDYLATSGGTVNYSFTIDPYLSGTTHVLTTAVTPPQGGTINPAAGTHTYTEGTVVPITASPNSGYAFSHWSGDCSGSGACSVTMSADRSVTANFTELPSYTLTVDRTGTGSGTVTSSPAGINCGSICSADFSSGTVVALTAAPTAGSTFTGWSGACTGTGTCNVTMTEARFVTATFTLNTYPLTVSREGSGSGTVTSSPAGIDCGATCSANFSYNTTVELTAAPAIGSTFTGWSGACTGTGTCSVTMTAARSVTATFTINTYTLTVSRMGSGSGRVTSAPAGIDCGTACSANFNYNTVVTLTPAAETGSTFTGWGGACTGTGACSVTMTEARSVTATFTLNTYLLTVSRDGNGSGTVTSSPAGIDCGATCSASFNYNTIVTLTAAPATGSTFTGWSGACTGTGTCSVTMTEARSVMATFTLNTYPLTVIRAGAGSGTVTSSPAGIDCGTTCSASFNYSQTVILTATPDSYSTFAGWSGLCTGKGTCSITMTEARSVTAIFDLLPNHAPVITEGTSVSVAMTRDGIPTPFALTLHASDVDLDTLTWSIQTPASHGTASASGTGTSKVILYTPDLHYVGPDSFVVQVADGRGGVATITVNVTIRAVIFFPAIFH